MSQGKPTAIITGASSGLGSHFALQLAALGYDLIITARREDKLQELAARITGSHKARVEIITGDLSTDAGVEMIEERIKGCPQLEYLVNNAGFGTTGVFDKVDQKKHQDMIHLHNLTPVRLCYRAIPVMKARGKGRIINVSSVGAFMASNNGAIYNATKAFLNSFTNSLDLGFSGTGIKFQALCPGLTRTGFHYTEEFRGWRLWAGNNLIWMDPQEVVSYSLEKIENSKQVIVIPGALNRILVALLKSSLTGWIIERLLNSEKLLKRNPAGDN